MVRASLVAQTVKNPETRRSPREGNGYPLQRSCLENSMDWGAWWATVHWVTYLDTTEPLITSIRMTITIIIKQNICWQRCGEIGTLESLYVAGGNVKWFSCQEKQSHGSSKCSPWNYHVTQHFHSQVETQKKWKDAHINTCTGTLIAPWFRRAKKWRLPKSFHEWKT